MHLPKLQANGQLFAENLLDLIHPNASRGPKLANNIADISQCPQLPNRCQYDQKVEIEYRSNCLMLLVDRHDSPAYHLR